MGRTLGPLWTASVKLAEKTHDGKPVEVFVGRGETLPDNLAAGEEQRLESLGAFSMPPRPVEMSVPEAAVTLTGYLPPAVTLGANPDDPDDDDQLPAKARAAAARRAEAAKGAGGSTPSES